MKVHKKMWLIFIIFVIVPIVLPFLFDCFLKGKYFYEYSCPSISFIIFSFVPLIGGVLVTYLNYKSGYKSKVWYVTAFIVILVYIIYLLSLNSLSNFGF